MELESKWSEFVKQAKRIQFGAKQQQAFLEDLYALISDGIPANRALEMLAKVTTGINKEVALSLSEKISEGQPLAEGMVGWFSINITEIIRAGEQGGALAETLKSAVNTMTQRTGAWGAVIGALLYPVTVLLAACCVIVYLNTSVFSTFRALKPVSEWPAAGQELVAIAEFITHWWWLTGATLFALVIVLRWMMNNYIGDLRPLLDKVPPFTLYRKFTAARVLETLGLLVANGVVFKTAVKIMQYNASPYVISHLVMMEHLLGMGKGNIADVLSTGLVADADILRLRVMAETKGFEHGLIRLGVRGAEESAKTLRTIAKIVGGILLICGGVLILMIIQGIYMTAMSMGAT